MGRSTIFIQPGAEGCSFSVRQAQDRAIVEANKLEVLMAENEFLLGRLDSCCVATEPTLMAFSTDN